MGELYEGDLIRPLGLVTLYFAYAEAELDELIETLLSRELYDDKKRRLPVGRKIHYAKKLIKALHADSLDVLTEKLNEALKLFERRNSIIHSCIFSGGRMVSNRKSVQNQLITGAELTQLAEDIFRCKDHINMLRWKFLAPLLDDARNS